MRRFLIPILVLIALAVSVPLWFFKSSPGTSVFKDFAPKSIGKTWTITGSPGSERLAITDPTGAIEPRRDSYCVYFFVYDRDQRRLYSPLLHNVRSQACLVDGCAPRVVWQTHDVLLRQTTFSDAEVCYSDLVVTNQSANSKRMSVFAAVLPQQVTGGMRSGFSVKCDPKTRSISVDGKVVVSCDISPDDMAASLDEQGKDITGYLQSGTLPRGKSAPVNLSLISSGAMRFDVTLDPKAKDRLCFRLPMKSIRVADWARSRKLSTDEASKQYSRRWNERLGRVGLQLPDKRVGGCFRASLAYLLMLSGKGRPTPGPAKYNLFWVRDAAYMADALYYAGQRDLIPPTVAHIRAMQLPNGGFLPRTNSARDDEFDAPGEAIYAMVQQYRRTGDARSLNEAWPGILSACRYIRVKRVTSDHSTGPGCFGHGSGILPASISAEDLGKGDQQHYWDDFWCVRGLRDGALAARKLGKNAEAAWMEAEADSLQRATLASVRNLKTPYIPNGPQDLASSAMARGTSCALWPCAVLDPGDPLTRGSFDAYWDKWIAPSGGGFVHNKGHYWPYAGMDLAQGYLMLGQRERAWQILDWTLDHDPTHGFYSWPEGMQTKDLTLAEGDMPHGWMCAAYISLVRNMLVRESGADLVLLSGVPKHWLKPGVRIMVRDFPTEFGTVSYSAEVSQNALKLTLSGAKPAGVYRVILPGNRETIVPAGTRQATVPL